MTKDHKPPAPVREWTVISNKDRTKIAEYNPQLEKVMGEYSHLQKFNVVEADAYAALKAENEELKLDLSMANREVERIKDDVRVAKSLPPTFMMEHSASGFSIVGVKELRDENTTLRAETEAAGAVIQKET